MYMQTALPGHLMQRLASAAARCTGIAIETASLLWRLKVVDLARHMRSCSATPISGARIGTRTSRSVSTCMQPNQAPHSPRGSQLLSLDSPATLTAGWHKNACMREKINTPWPRPRGPVAKSLLRLLQPCSMPSLCGPPSPRRLISHAENCSVVDQWWQQDLPISQEDTNVLSNVGVNPLAGLHLKEGPPLHIAFKTGS